MTRRLFSLILSQLDMNFAISHSRYYYLKKRRRLWEGVLIAVSFVIAACALSFGMYKLADVFYSQAAAIGQEGLTLITGILAAQFLMLILGVSLVIAVFYFSNDLPVLIPFPLRPWEVLTAKFVVILANEYLGLSVFLIPVFVVYGARANVGLMSYIFSSGIVFLTLPVIPLAIASVLGVILMRIVGSTKRKDTLTIIGGFLLVAFVVGIQMYIQTKVTAPGGEQEFILDLLSQANGLVPIVGKQFPPSIWATLAVSSAGTFEGLANLALFVGAGAVCFALFLMLGNRVFYQGVLSGFEASHPKRDTSMKKSARTQFRERSQVIALAVAEMKLFTRTPVFVLNGFVGFFMFPAVFAVIMFMSLDPEVKRLVGDLMAMPQFPSIGSLIVGAYLFLLTAFSGIPFSPFSREGKANIWFLKSQPVSGRTLAFGKALACEIMILLGSIPGVGVFQYIAGLPVAYLATGLVLGIIGSLALCIWGVLLDMARPMLDWTDPQKAVKSNLNTIIGIFVGMIVLFLLGFLVNVLFRKGYSGFYVLAISGLIVTSILASGLRTLQITADRLWSSIEL